MEWASECINPKTPKPRSQDTSQLMLRSSMRTFIYSHVINWLIILFEVAKSLIIFVVCLFFEGFEFFLNRLVLSRLLSTWLASRQRQSQWSPQLTLLALECVLASLAAGFAAKIEEG